MIRNLTIIQFSICIVIWIRIIIWVRIRIVKGIWLRMVVRALQTRWVILRLIAVVVIDTGVYYILIWWNVMLIVEVWIVILMDHVDLGARWWCNYDRRRNDCGLSHLSTAVNK